MDASQYKDYVLVLLFIKYVSDKFAGIPYAPVTIPKGSSFQDLVALKGTQASISLQNVRDFEIAVPDSRPEQTAIAAVLDDMDAEIAALEDKLAKARQIKQGMMQNLFTGRIRLV